jgi:sec-independent protein translocase protein TatB
MFGLSWGQIAIIVLVGVFVLGPERIPTAVTWVLTSLRKIRTMAAGAQAELRREIGPEIDELRRQVADLQSLKEIQELRDLRDLHPKRLIGKNILGDEFSGGITGFLGLNEQPLKPSAAGPGGVPNPVATNDSATNGAAPPSGGAQPAVPSPVAPSAVRPASPSMTKLAPPKVVGQFTPRAPRPELKKVERAPFDPDGT